MLQADYHGIWIDEIVNLLKHGILLQDKQVAKKMRIKAAIYALFNKFLYMRSLSQQWPKCVSKDDKDYILHEIYMRICCNHYGLRTLTRKCYLVIYYWLTLNQDALELGKNDKRARCMLHYLMSPIKKILIIALDYLFNGRFISSGLYHVLQDLFNIKLSSLTTL